eukprot:TRINITY_DN10981_c0_g1_i1.p1 TRINITY_DN10981_c0_g1~~TRINITY_DN10981_c0_g1_i1.p1  ORF type:complete len:269 (+),score=40.80 TRINITY_DN10981_c0_g1_i1:19-825(+)
MEAFRKIYPSEFYKKFLVQNVRPDGRGLQKVRRTTVSVGSITTAHGSSFVKIGNTALVCGVKAEIGNPAAAGDRQLVTNVELLPICNAQFRPGKPSDQAHAVAQLLNDLGATLLDTSNLTGELSSGKYSWYLYADIYCLDYDGNILDAALASLIAALQNVRLPTLSLSAEGQLQVSPTAETRLSLAHQPFSLSFGLLEEYVIVDPNAEEESLLNGTISIVMDDRGNVLNVLKSGGIGVSEPKLDECMNLTKKRVKELVTVLDQTLSAS